MAKYDSYGFITELDENEIFVFGSNLAGRHGAGAAKQARDQFGAIYGQGEGLQGQSYAFPTLDHDLKQLRGAEFWESIVYLVDTALAHPELRFLVTKVGCGLGGYDEEWVIEQFRLFLHAYELPTNLIFPDDWQNRIFE